MQQGILIAPKCIGCGSIFILRNSVSVSPSIRSWDGTYTCHTCGLRFGQAMIKAAAQREIETGQITLVTPDSNERSAP